MTRAEIGGRSVAVIRHMSSSNAKHHVRQLLLLRTIVAALGERVTPPWWRTQFLTDFGLRTVARIFPRTPICVALDSAFAAARLEHDRRIGLGKRYHLFRLSESMESAIQGLIAEPTLSAQATTLVANGPNELMHQLASVASGRKEAAVDGPIGLGSIARMTEPTVLPSLAAHYWNSFDSSRRVFPYFSEPGERR